MRQARGRFPPWPRLSQCHPHCKVTQKLSQYPPPLQRPPPHLLGKVRPPIRCLKKNQKQGDGEPFYCIINFKSSFSSLNAFTSLTLKRFGPKAPGRSLISAIWCAGRFSRYRRLTEECGFVVTFLGVEAVFFSASQREV